jgi:hypothetical protein
MVHMTTNALSIPGHRYALRRGLNAWAFRHPNTLRRSAGLRKKQVFHHGLAKGQSRPKRKFLPRMTKDGLQC